MLRTWKRINMVRNLVHQVKFKLEQTGSRASLLGGCIILIPARFTFMSSSAKSVPHKTSKWFPTYPYISMYFCPCPLPMHTLTPIQGTHYSRFLLRTWQRIKIVWDLACTSRCFFYANKFKPRYTPWSRPRYITHRYLGLDHGIIHLGLDQGILPWNFSCSYCFEG